MRLIAAISPCCDRILKPNSEDHRCCERYGYCPNCGPTVSGRVVPRTAILSRLQVDEKISSMKFNNAFDDLRGAVEELHDGIMRMEDSPWT